MIQYNLKQIVLKADEISQEFRRTIHLDYTKKSGKRLRLLRELLEMDNQVRDVLAKLRQANSKINFDTNPEALLKNQEFLEHLYGNLTEMFRSFEKINTVMQMTDNELDDLVIDTISHLDTLSTI